MKLTRFRTLDVCLATVAVLGVLSVRSAAADNITLAWDPSSSQVSGYNVYVGTQSGTYSQRVDVGGATQYTLSTATAGQRYCFAVSAYMNSLEGAKSTEVCGYSNAPPTLTNPGNQSSSVGQSVSLQLVGSDPASQPLTYSATGLPPGLTLMASTGFISGAPTTAGTYNVNARASDGGLTASQAFTWTVTTGSSSDKTAPTVTITGPTSAATYTSTTSTLTLAGTASDNVGVTQVSWVNDRGGNGVATGTTSWSAGTIALQGGTNVITVQARDAAGNVSNDVLTVTAPGSSSGAMQLLGVTANKTAPQPAGTSITLTASATGGSGSYRYLWTLFNGTTWNMVQTWSSSPSYTWTPTAANSAYRFSVWVKNATNTADAPEVEGFIAFPIGTTAPAVDTAAPTVTIAGPTGGTTFSTTATSLTLTGTATDNTGVTQVSWTNDRGGSGSATGTTNWSAGPIALQSGANVLTITARDAAGNTGTDVLTVTASTASGGGGTGGALQLLGVTANKTAPQPAGTTITLTASATGGTGSYSYLWTLYNGSSWDMVQNWSSSPNFNWTPTTANSAYRFSVWVKNSNSTASSPEVEGFISFPIGTTAPAPDTAAPTVTIAGPTGGTTFSTTATSVTLTGTATDNTGVTQVSWANDRGGSGTATGTANWSTGAITLQSGANVLTITARDAAGNTGTDVLTVTASTTSGGGTSGPLQLTGVTADKPAPQPAGSTITLTAAATGGTGSYRYQWTLFDGTNWNMVQAWSSSPSFTWRPTSTNSAYRFAVWVKNANNTADAPEVEGFISFPIGGTTTTPPPSGGPTGLVAAYGMNEGTGATVNDGSGKGLGGSVSGATWTTQGKFGSALSFDGVNDWVTVNDAPGLDFTTGMTMEAWVFPTATGGGSWRNVIMKERPNGEVYNLYANADTNVPVAFVVPASSFVPLDVHGSGSVPANTWTHLAVTYDNSVLRLFVNGQQVGTQAVSGPLQTSGGALRIGGNSIWGEYFQGRIDEVRLYNRALTSAEVQTDMNTPVN